MSLKLTLGIDIGGTNTVFGYVDEKGECYATASIPTLASEGPIQLFDRISDKAKEIAKKIPSPYELVGVGMGAPNANYYTGTVISPPNLGWSGITDVVTLANQHFNVPAVVTNDANATALGEKLFGVGKNLNHFVVITLGTGLGSGIVVNGDLLYGADGLAGEMGHTTAIMDGRLCGCGKKGCLETYCSATGIVTTVKELLKKDKRKSILRDIPEASITSKLIGDAAKKNDELALEAFDYTGKILGIAAADAVAYFNCEAIILFGGLAQAGDLITEPTKKYMEEFLLPVFRNKVKLLITGLPEAQSAVLGASALIWNELNKKA